ncbi:MAG TPA: hypothetical protein VGK92_05825 [Gaiellales bacterium]
MKRRLDSIIIGGAMLFGGMAHRRAGHVARQVDDLGEAVEAVEETLRETAARPAERAAIPGMPLPTGYGLQVRGPDDESIILPVCLPPGFELASMVLCPEFLPAPQQAPARAPVPAPAAAARPQPALLPDPAPAPRPAPAPAAARTAAPPAVPVRERLSGTLQYVFGNDPGFSMDETFGGAVDAAPEAEQERPRRAGGIETHHL